MIEAASLSTARRIAGSIIPSTADRISKEVCALSILVLLYCACENGWRPVVCLGLPGGAMLCSRRLDGRVFPENDGHQVGHSLNGHEQKIVNQHSKKDRLASSFV